MLQNTYQAIKGYMEPGCLLLSMAYLLYAAEHLSSHMADLLHILLDKL